MKIIKSTAIVVVAVGLILGMLVVFHLIGWVNLNFGLERVMKHSTILIGSSGVFFSLGGVLLYYSVLEKNASVLKNNNFQQIFYNALSLMVESIIRIKYNNPLPQEGSRALKSINISITNLVKESLENSNGTYRSNDKSFLGELNSYYFGNYSEYYRAPLLNAKYILKIIDEKLDDTGEKKDFYNLLKANLPQELLVALYYYFCYELNRFSRVGGGQKPIFPKEKEQLTRIINDSGIFKELNVSELIFLNHKRLLNNLK